MEEQDFFRYIDQVAKRNGVSREEVIRDIENCIGESYRAVQQAYDPQILRQWAELSADGELPTAFSFVVHVAELVRIELTEQKRAEFRQEKTAP